MARPLKTGLDYFPHDTDACHDEKIENMRSVFGNDGYAFYFILLERIYRDWHNGNGGLKCSTDTDRKILAAKVGVPVAKFNDMLSAAMNDFFLFDAKVFEKSGRLTSSAIDQRVRDVLARRQAARDGKDKKKHNYDTGKYQSLVCREAPPQTPPIKENERITI